MFVGGLFLLRAGAHISISLLPVSSFLQPWLVFHGAEIFPATTLKEILFQL